MRAITPTRWSGLAAALAELLWTLHAAVTFSDPAVLEPPFGRRLPGGRAARRGVAGPPAGARRRGGGLALGSLLAGAQRGNGLTCGATTVGTQKG